MIKLSVNMFREFAWMLEAFDEGDLVWHGTEILDQLMGEKLEIAKEGGVEVEGW